MNELWSTLRGFKFNGKHNYKDLGVIMHSRSIQPPPKKKIKESVPFMNGSYDFSTVGSNGEIVYGEREITVVLGLPSTSKEQLQILYSKILEWISDSGQCQLIFDDVIDYYYMAEVENASSFEEAVTFGRLSITFVAEPFKTSVNYISDDIWDTFNFEEDISQNVEFDVTNSISVMIYNVGRGIVPTVSCSSAMTVTLLGLTYNLVEGNNTLYALSLSHGENRMTVTGNGHIKFLFRKKVL